MESLYYQSYEKGTTLGPMEKAEYDLDYGFIAVLLLSKVVCEVL